MALMLEANMLAALLQIQYIIWLKVFQNNYLEDIYIINYCLVLLSKVMSSFQDRKPAHTKAEHSGCLQPVLTASATAFQAQQPLSSSEGKTRS